MPIHFDSEQATVWHGDCIEVMRDLPDASVDSVVTDPPYGLEFMGREWDGADGFRRSMNPNDAGRDSVFGRTSATSPEYKTAGRGNSGAQFAEGTVGGYEGKPMPRYGKRWTQRRCETCGHVDGGGSPCRCESPAWVVTSEPGTPRFAATFQAWCELWATEALRVLKPGGHMLAFGGTRTFHRLASAIEDAGFEIRDSIAWLYGSGFPKSRNLDGDWKGWGTALKPAFEPIVVARKPLTGTVQSNVEQHGTGALNIDASRVPALDAAAYAAKGASVVGLDSNRNGAAYGEWKGSRTDSTSDLGRWPANVIVDEAQAFPEARFFYTAKASADERPNVDGVAHPTVKPLDLMQWLVRLVTPRGGTVLEPFAGSGTTIEACVREGFRCIAIEREGSYLPLILKRLDKPHAQSLFDGWVAS